MTKMETSKIKSLLPMLSVTVLFFMWGFIDRKSVV